MAKKRASVPKIRTADDLLANHLKIAEEHLIAAVELFARKHPPKRTQDYIQKLGRVQETLTSLYREELVRIRGPLRPPRRVGRR